VRETGQIDQYDLYHGSEDSRVSLRGNISEYDILFMLDIDGAQLYKDKE
jgi:hypothetical protein